VVAQFFGIRPRHGAGIAVIVLHFVLLLLWYFPYFRILQTIATNPGVIPTGPPDAEKETTTNGLERFYEKEMFVSEHGGTANPRWCNKCRIWKPDRAHHCSEINRCVRRMDHFCPWVGGIVSETNYKFFLQFCFYAAVYTTFMVIVLSVVIAERVRKVKFQIFIV
jgi:palmitoyltransferase